MKTQSPAKTRGVIVLLALVALIAGLHFAGRFGLQGPARFDLESVRAWTSDPVVTIATVARWLSLGLAYYLAIVVGAVIALGERFEGSIWERFAPSRTSGLLALVLGTSAVLVPLMVHDQTNDVRALQLAEAAAEPLDLRQVEAPLRLIEEGAEQEHDRDIRLVWSATWTDATEHALDDRWHVESGDSFWSIAEETLHDEHPELDLTEGVIVDYWRTLIQANEDRLIDPTNPDFILPGQVVVLPPTT